MSDVVVLENFGALRVGEVVDGEELGPMLALVRHCTVEEFDEAWAHYEDVLNGHAGTDPRDRQRAGDMRRGVRQGKSVIKRLGQLANGNFPDFVGRL